MLFLVEFNSSVGRLQIEINSLQEMLQYLFRINLEHALWESLPRGLVLKTRWCCLGIAFWVLEKILLTMVTQLLATTSESPQHVVFYCHSSKWVWNSLSPTAMLGFLSELPVAFCNSLSIKLFDTGMRGCLLLSSSQCLLGLSWYAAVGRGLVETSLQAGKKPTKQTLEAIRWMTAKCNYFSLVINAGGKWLFCSKRLPILIAWLYLMKMEHCADSLLPDF